MRGRGAGVIGGWAAVLLLTGVVTRGAIALPEHCGDATAPRVQTAIDRTLGWFSVNQRADGRWLYRFDASAGRDLGGYSWVRHAGVLLSLYQAAGAGEPGALDGADRGRTAILDGPIVRGTGWTAVNDGGLTAGGTALLVAALGERRDVTGDTADDELLRSLGRFLVRQVEPSGAVLEHAQADGTPTPGFHSPFTTGEVLFALARLHRQFPGEGWDAPALRIAGYVVAERANAEGYVPDTSDHWSAYAFAEIERWPERASSGLTADELGFARRQLGLMSIQTRYETQRTNGGVSRLTRGRRALGAAAGTIGEAMGQWWDVGAREPALDGRRAGLRDRVVCMAGAIVDRQVDPAEAAATGHPTQTLGAHLQFGITQMDDQQHTLSALLAAERVLADPRPLPRRSPIPTNTWIVAFATLFCLNPLRLAQGGRRLAAGPARRAREVGIGGGVTLAVSAVLAALGGPLVRALDVSAGNALIAAGVVLVAGGVWTLATPDEAETTGPGTAGLVTPLLIPLGLRPDLLLLAVACGAGGRGWLFTAALAVAAAAAVVLVRLPEPPVLVTRWLMRLLGTLATATALALVIDGVYSI